MEARGGWYKGTRKSRWRLIFFCQWRFLLKSSRFWSQLHARKHIRLYVYIEVVSLYVLIECLIYVSKRYLFDVSRRTWKCTYFTFICNTVDPLVCFLVETVRISKNMAHVTGGCMGGSVKAFRKCLWSEGWSRKGSCSSHIDYLHSDYDV